MNYYNEFDPKAAAWIRALITAGAIPPGDVDERSIEDVRPSDLAGYTQCHFFAGIAGWSYALALGGWPSSRPVWTGSCPCQPFSAAGKGAGFDDQRHLWPAWFHLIRECRPPAIFGEQVASKAADPWIDLVHADLEGMGYAFGCVPFSSAGVGAPHIRDRNYWVGMADANNTRLEGWRGAGERAAEFAAGARGLVGGVEYAHMPIKHERPPSWEQPIRDRHGADGFWRNSDWIECADGKCRPIEPGTFPLAHGLPARVGRLRGYGNAINPHQAAEFVMACGEVMQSELEQAA